MRKFFLGISIFAIFYTIFWLYILDVLPKNKKNISQNVQHSISNTILPTPTIADKVVLGASTDITNVTINVPDSYSNSITPRKQVFNLSCEFAAAAGIIYSFTNNQLFSPQNELTAEKALLQNVVISQNPNIGVRMGVQTPNDYNALYKNLNQRFGGADYYGVHAPPFIDLFALYNLKAVPIHKDNQLYAIKKAVFSGHLVMTWIKVGYGNPVDVALSYGTTKVVKGEHAVVIYGYDKTGVFVMDPGSGFNRHINYDILLNSTKDFSMPFLEVFPSTNRSDYDPTQKVDLISGLDRSVIKILVKNGNGIVGSANRMAEILQDFGYHVLDLQKSDGGDYIGITISIKNEIADYKELIRKDIALAGYNIKSFNLDLPSESSNDVLVVVGEE